MKNTPHNFADSITNVVVLSDSLYNISKKMQDKESADNIERINNVLSLETVPDHIFEILDMNRNIEKKNQLFLRAKMQKAIERLTKSQQELINLAFYEGKSQKEIAEMKGMNPVAIKEWLSRILNKLKSILEEMNFKEDI